MHGPSCSHQLALSKSFRAIYMYDLVLQMIVAVVEIGQHPNLISKELTDIPLLTQL